MKEEIKRKLLKINALRRAVQFLSFLFFSAVIFNFAALPLLLPILWTWSLTQNMVGDAFTALQLVLSGWKDTPVAFPWLALSSFFIIGTLLGKTLCGWVCPFGFIQDLIDFVKHKKAEISPRTHESMIYIKYGILGITLLISGSFAAAKLAQIHGSYENALGIFAYAPFTTLSPAETLFAKLPKMILDFRNAISQAPFFDVISGIWTLPPLFLIQLFIMVGVLAFAVYIPRGWCRYFCPHGAIMAIMNRFSFLGLRRDLVKCAKGECRACVEACPMRVRILDLPWEKFSDPECIYCLKCVDACPNKAIKLKYP
ncbi:4Fe-4S binding protein [Candidatus Bathyarchaeota archaeon]|nr:4Fe-4S binding protein [Candidatus Bathyarchaeota archaeon]